MFRHAVKQIRSEWLRQSQAFLWADGVIFHPDSGLELVRRLGVIIDQVPDCPASKSRFVIAP